MNLYQPTITGSLSVSGSINISGSINVVGGGGTITGTASYATNAELLDGLDSTVFTLTSSFAAQTASFTAFTASILSYTASQNILNGTYTLTSSFAAQTASFTAFTSSVNTFTASINSFSASVLSYTSSLNAKTSSFATTGSNTFEGIQTINSNLVVTGSITAQTLVVQTITSSVDFVTGSTRFGSILGNTHVFSGSVTMNPGGLFVSGSGSVLIGSTSPAGTEKFGVTRDDGVADGLHIIADFNRSGSLSAELILGYYASGSAVTGPVVYAANSQPLLFGAGSAERMRLTTTGNLGIGTTNPVGKLDVALVNTRRFIVTYDDSIITIKGASDTGAGENLRVIGDNLIFNTNSVGSGTERMRITSAGHIGINTSSPVSTSLTGSITIYKAYNADQASVPSTTAQAYYGNQHGLYLFGRNSGLTIVSANSEEGSIKFGNASTNVYATIGTTTGTSAVGGDMIFRVGSDTERMRISGSGQIGIGIGTSSWYQPYTKLIVGGAIAYNNNADGAVSDNSYGMSFAKKLNIVAGSGANTIYSAAGSEAALYVVTGLNLTAGTRFADVVLYLGAGSTAPVVIASQTYAGSVTRTYANSGENLTLSLTGNSNTYTIRMTGMGANERT